MPCSSDVETGREVVVSTARKNILDTSLLANKYGSTKISINKKEET